MSSGRKGTLYSVHSLEAQSTKLSPHTTALCRWHQRGTPCVLERRVSTIAHFQVFETRNISKYIFDFLPVCASDFGALPSKVGEASGIPVCKRNEEMRILGDFRGKSPAVEAQHTTLEQTFLGHAHLTWRRCQCSKKGATTR